MSSPYTKSKEVFVEGPDGDSVCIVLHYHVQIIPGKRSSQISGPGYPDEFIERLVHMHIVGLRPSWLTDDMLRRLKDKYNVFTYTAPEEIIDGDSNGVARIA